MLRDFFDPTPEQQNVVLDPQEPAKCPNCRGEILELLFIHILRQVFYAFHHVRICEESARRHLPEDLEFGTDGKLYVADTGNSVVRRIDLGTGTIERVAGTGKAGYSGDYGPPLQAQLDSPYGLAFDAAGNLYIADTLNNRIRIVRK